MKPAKKKVDMNLPEPLLQEIERYVQSGLYSNRTEFVKAAIRDKLLAEAQSQ
jgi:Arc/MetJ-type ribon-helix-helix transcriptional regulator